MVENGENIWSEGNFQNNLACLIAFCEKKAAFLQNCWLKIEKINDQRENSKIPLELLLQTQYNLF